MLCQDLGDTVQISCLHSCSWRNYIFTFAQYLYTYNTCKTSSLILRALVTCITQSVCLAGDASDRHFMAYNALGCIICKEAEDHHVLEVALHDTRAQRRRMPNLNDLYRFSMASLGDRVGPQQLTDPQPLCQGAT